MRGLFDTLVNVYRIDDNSVNGSGYDLGEVNQTPTLVHVNCRSTFQVPMGNSRDEGAGSRPATFMLCLIEKKFAVKDADIIRIVRGPQQSSEYWIVQSVFTPSNARWHRELAVKPYIGEFPVVE